MKSLRNYLFALACVAFVSYGNAQPNLKPSEYSKWESLGQSRLSPKGDWVATSINLVEGEGRLILRSTTTEKSWTMPSGSNPTFSKNGKWFACSLGYPPSEIEKMTKEGKRPENRFSLRNLETGEELKWEAIQQFAFANEGKQLIAQRYRGAQKPSGGSDLLLLDLSDNSLITLGNVSSFSMPRKGATAALIIDSDSGNNGIQLLDTSTGAIRNLDFGKNTFTGITWSENGQKMAYFRSTTDAKKEGVWNEIVIVTNLDSKKPTLQVLDPKTVKGFPVGKRIVESNGIAFAKGDDKIQFGIRSWEDRKPPQPIDDKPGVDVWHWQDLIVQPRQKMMLNMIRSRSYTAVWTIESGAFVQLTNDKLRQIELTDEMDFGLGIDDFSHTQPTTNGIDFQDIYWVNAKDGSSKKILDKTHFGASLSRTGKYVVYWQDKNWWLCETSTGNRTNLTKDSGTDFSDLLDDHTFPEPIPVSFPRWLANDAALLLSDNYDTWMVRPGGKLTKLTNGRKSKTVWQFTPVNAKDGAVSLGQPLYFTVFDTINKTRGYSRINPNGAAETLIFENKWLERLSKAEDSDVFMFTTETFVDSPNLFVCDNSFKSPKQMTATNPQQKDYAWGKTELIHYKSKFGAGLQGILIYPAGYVEGRQYPMITYIYERLSDGLNRYAQPSNRNAYNTQYFSQSGYFVFMPDITYQKRNPGLSAVQCLEPAVQAVLKKGMVNPSKVGLMGHSWGAYQTAFLLSASKVFSAGVAGAPLTDLISMYLGVYWNSGTPNQEIFETSQGRMEVPFWEDMSAYIANSPIFNAKNITAPILVTFGDQDGAVDWHQGIEMFNTLRRMGKEIVMLVYAGENHGLAKKPNQIDYANRVRHFFDVKLKGMPPQDWLKNGISLDKKGSG